MTLGERDQKIIWHPFTQHQLSPVPVPLVRGEGAYLFDEKGNRYLDLISSWWVNLHGHSHPVIAEAIYQQAMTLEHAIFSGFTHEPAVALGEELLKLLPHHFSKIFYSDNGSTSVEVAIKMAYQYWQNQNKKQKKHFIAFENGYHGDTFGSMAVGKDTAHFHSKFSDLLFPVKTFPYPGTWLNDSEAEEKEQQVLALLRDYLELHGADTAALIIEPLLQGVGNMQVCRSEFLQQLEKLTHEFQVLTIYDEVLTGFGRTGDYFACNKAKTSPDIICLAKGLTGGFLPLGATVCHEKIFQAFLGDNFSKALAHGHSYTANPLGCAAALASMKLLKNEKTQQQITMIENVHQREMCRLLKFDFVEKPRYCGTMAAFDIKSNIEYGSAASIAMREQILQDGLLVRPLGRVVYFIPPYCITEEELTRAYHCVTRAIEGVTA